ncbi:MAG: DUF3592 domain-containing protein [Marmoricola sp.]
MAVTEGDPRTAAPELYARLSATEQRYADSAFQERLALAGLNDPQYPDDEPAVTVAAGAVQAAARRLSARVAQTVWAVFVALALSTILWPGLKGPFMLTMFLVAVAVSVLSTVNIYRRKRQISELLGPAPQPTAVATAAQEMPVLHGQLGPDQLAPVLLRRMTRVERASVKGFFPGAGQVSTGTPDWNGSPHDRRRLRRCFTAVNTLGLVLFWFIGSMLLDAGVSAFTHPKGGVTGFFVLGWVAGDVWFVRRQIRVRRWYAAGLGHEAELASRATAVPPAPPAPATPRQRALLLALFLAAGVYFTWVGVTGALSLNQERIDTHPFADGTTVSGIVTTVRENDSGPTFRAISTFTDARGKTHRVTSQSGEEHKPRVGDHVRISYLPSDPGSARDLTTNVTAWKFPMATSVFAVLAGVFMIGSSAYGAMRLRRPKAD